MYEQKTMHLCNVNIEVFVRYLVAFTDIYHICGIMSIIRVDFLNFIL